MNTTPIAKSFDGPETLAPWEEQFARWMAMQTTRVDADAELACVATLIGHPLTITQIKRTKRKILWKKCYQISRAELFEVQLAQARAKAMSIAPKAMKVYGKAVNVLDAELDRAAESQRSADGKDARGVDVDPMKALRAAPHLLNPWLDRVAPKKVERTGSDGPKIVINLSHAQSQALDGPVLTVSAEEVKQLPANSLPKPPEE